MILAIRITQHKLWRRLDVLFPEIEVGSRRIPLPTGLLVFAVLTGLFSLLGFVLPADGFIGFDWVNFFGQNRIPPFYPPWALLVTHPLTWPLLIGLTLASFSLAVLLRSVSPFSAAISFFSLPLLWTLFLGQVDGLALLGVIGLPWLVPLALLKPQVSIFALGARRSYLVALFVFLMLSLIVWGLWPLKMLMVNSYYGEGRYAQDISLGLWGAPLFLATVWFSRGDVDMLMLSGSFVTFHLIPYNLLPLAPAITRLRPRNALIGVVLSWLPFSANWLGPAGWYLGWLYVVWLWLNLAARRYPNVRALSWLK